MRKVVMTQTNTILELRKLYFASMSFTDFCGGCFLNDSKSKRQVLFSYLHYGGLNE